MIDPKFSEIGDSLAGNESFRTRVPDRFVPKAISGDMVVISGRSSPFSSPTKQQEDCKGCECERNRISRFI